MKKATTRSIFAVLLVGMVSAAVFAYIQHEKDVELAAKRAPLLAALRDPASAQFRDDNFIRGNTHLCGEFNAKNSMGGYVGFKRYISFEQGYAIEGDSILSFYPGTFESLDAVTRNLERENEILRERIALSKQGITPPVVTQEEKNILAFNEIWASHCPK